MKEYKMTKGFTTTKKTTIGKKNLKTSSMNKAKKRSYKPSRGQG